MIDRLEAFGVAMSLDLLLVISLYIAFSAGLFSLASVGCMAIGAYGAAITQPDVGTPMSIVIGVACAVAVAGVTGPLLLRIQGVYLAMATLAFSEGIRVLAIGLRGLTGGISGRFTSDIYIKLPQIAASVIVVAVATWFLIDRTRIGMRYRIIREDTDLASSTGVNVRNYQYGAFLISAGVAGLGGSLKGLAFYALTPEEFSFRALVDGLAPVVVGGLSSVIAPVLAALALGGFVEYLRSIREYEPIIYGIVIIVCYLLLPGGAGSRWSWLQLWWRLGGRRAPEEAHANEVTRKAAADQARGAVRARPVASDVVGSTLLEVRGVGRTFAGVRAVHDVSFVLRSGEVLGLVGPNGAGKTTLINAICGVHPPDAGEVIVAGRDLAGRPVHVIARAGVRRVFQGTRIIETLGPTQNMLGADQGGRLLDVMPGRDERPIGVRNFSYGAKRWLEIARAVRGAGQIYIFDEPTTGLPKEGVEEFKKLVRELSDRSAGVLLVEHNVALIRSACDRVIVLDFGELVAEGDPNEVFDEAVVRRAYLGEADVART